MKKSVVMVYTGDDWSAPAPVTGSPLTTRAFEDWFGRAERHGFEMYRAEISWFDLASGVFQKVWGFRQGRWEKISRPIKPDLIFDKISSRESWPLFDLKKRIAQRTKFFNDPLFRAMIDGKAQQYLMFGDLMPRSGLANSRAELDERLKAFTGEKVVAKPLYGSGGKGIIIDIPARVRAKAGQLKYPVLLQEFVTSSIGIPGFSIPPCLADLRVIFSDHRPVCALTRRAKPGSLFTNLHQGATAELVPLRQIPPPTQLLIKRVIAKLQFFPEALYTLDFLFRDDGRPILIELNTTPGADIIYNLGDEKVRESFFRACIVDHLS